MMDILSRLGSIPKVAVTSLVLGGACASSHVAGGGSGTGGTPSIRQIAHDFCEFQQRCEPDYFIEYYSSISNCTNTFNDLLQTYLDYYRTEYGADCADAMLDYYVCIDRALPTLACDSYYEETCLAESDRLSELCDYYSASIPPTPAP